MRRRSPPISAHSKHIRVRAEQDNITQQIAIDGVIVAAFVYHIERTLPGSPPSVELVDFQKYKPQSRRMGGATTAAAATSSRLSSSPSVSQSSSSSRTAAAAAASPGFHSNVYSSPLMSMDFASPSASVSLGDYGFDPPSMYRTSPPHMTATTSASVLYGSPH